MDSLLPIENERQALERIVASRTLRDSEALRGLLLYLGEASLGNRAEQLKEYTVGIEALGRPSHYDPRTDSSARALAARLRRKIEEYYAKEGVGDTMRVGFPKGGFVLTFEHLPDPPARVDSAEAVTKWKRIAGACLGASLLSISLFLLRGRPAALAPALPWNAELETFWQPFLDERTPIVVSFGSPLFVGLSNAFVRWPAINDWGSAVGSSEVKGLASFFRAPGPGHMQIKPNYDYAGIGDVHGAFLLARLLSSKKPEQLSLKRGIVLSWEDIKNNHLFFIGNGKNQANLRDILADRDFAVGETAIRNLKPRSGEPLEFREMIDERTGERREDYALLTYLPGLEQGRNMLLLSAMSTETIWGAVEAVTNPKFVTPLVAHLRSGGGFPRAFQAVVKIRLGAGVPVEVSYSTHHVLRSSEPR